MNRDEVTVRVTFRGPDGWRGARYTAKLARPRRQLSVSYDYAVRQSAQREHLAFMLASEWYSTVEPIGVSYDGKATVHVFKVG